MLRRVLLAGLLATGCNQHAFALEWTGRIDLEAGYYTHAPVDPRQQDIALSAAFEGEFYHTWRDGRSSLTFTPYYRLDAHDEQRRHGDIRELSWVHAEDRYEWRVGIRKVFWGVTESAHLVDIINQTDLVDNLDGEDKLGQPMINFAWVNDAGTLDVFILPYFRERTFPGKHARTRGHPRVVANAAGYASSREQKHVDWALRWSQVAGDWDVGLSWFDGTGRDPRMLAKILPDGELVLTPYYAQIRQASLDVQATKGGWLWKLEAIHRRDDTQGYKAAAGGFEYTFFGVMDQRADLGVILEYLYDDRGDEATTPFQHDLMLGLRLGMNDEYDSQLLFGVISDLEGRGHMLNLEASRRLSDHWTVELEARAFSSDTMRDPLYAFRRDDYAQLLLSYHF